MDANDSISYDYRWIGYCFIEKVNYLKLPKLKRDDLVEIHWLDITSTTSWKTTEEAETYIAITCHSVGYFLNADEEVIRISDTKNDEGERNVNIIIKGCIKSISKLKR